MPASYVGGEYDADALFGELQKQVPDGHREFIEEVLAKYGVGKLPDDAPSPRELLGWTEATARPQVDVSLSHKISLLANALGPPPADVVAEAHKHGVKVAALAGGAHHARKQVDVGVDVIVAQGTEAAGHTPDVSTMVLVPEVVEAVSPTPVLAAGGIGGGKQMAAGLALGAVGVWTGSIWLTVSEASTQPAVRDKLLRATSRDTVRSRAMTGKPARQLRTAWTDAWDDPNTPAPLPMPLQFMATAEAIHRIYLSEQPDLLGMPVGQIVGAMNDVRPSKDVIESMIAECRVTIDRLRGMAK
jgi:NAD(P)H-dependent flavin oxidoreductase YrpB (nitropropane dioxygenase family)